MNLEPGPRFRFWTVRSKALAIGSTCTVCAHVTCSGQAQTLASHIALQLCCRGQVYPATSRTSSKPISLRGFICYFPLCLYTYLSALNFIRICRICKSCCLLRTLHLELALAKTNRVQRTRSYYFLANDIVRDCVALRFYLALHTCVLTSSPLENL